MKFVTFICLGLLAGILPSRSSGAEAQSIQSRSGQFVVHGLPPTARSLPLPSPAAAHLAQLNPSVLAVSCEQIKQALLQALDLPDQWRGRIQVTLYPRRRVEDDIRIISVHYSDGWSFRLDLPEYADRDLVFRAMVDVLLRELASRNTQAQRQPEIPIWLLEGLVTHLEAVAPGDLALPGGQRRAMHQRRRDSLAMARECLRSNQALTLQALSWPTAENLYPPGMNAYRASAQLLLYELMRLKDGRACLIDMIRALPSYLNWQGAFLRGFRNHFPTLAAVDRWWALTIVNFTGHEDMFLWSGAESLLQLQELLTVPVHVRVRQSDLPMDSRISVQKVISEWDFANQFGLLMEKVNHLQALRLRAPPNEGHLVDSYREVLALYLQKRRVTSRASVGRGIAQETVKKLESLDARRHAWVPVENPTAPSPRVAVAPQ